MMSTLFTVDNIENKDGDINRIRMNALYLDLISSSAQIDNQSFALKKYLSDFYVSAKNSIVSSVKKFFSFNLVKLDNTKKLVGYTSTVSYTDIQNVTIEVPEGLNVQLLDYTKYVIEAQKRSNKIIENLIDPFSVYISKLLTDKVFRFQAGHDIKSFINMEKDYQACVNSIAVCFKKNNYKTRLKFNQAFKRNQDLVDTFKLCEELEKLVNDFPASEIVKKLNILYELLDKLNDIIKNDELNNVDKNVTQLLSKGIYHVAREIELAGLQTFRSKTLITTMNLNNKNLTDVIGKMV